MAKSKKQERRTKATTNKSADVNNKSNTVNSNPNPNPIPSMLAGTPAMPLSEHSWYNAYREEAGRVLKRSLELTFMENLLVNAKTEEDIDTIVQTFMPDLFFEDEEEVKIMNDGRSEIFAKTLGPEWGDFEHVAEGSMVLPDENKSKYIQGEAGRLLHKIENERLDNEYFLVPVIWDDDSKAKMQNWVLEWYNAFLDGYVLDEAVIDDYPFINELTDYEQFLKFTEDVQQKDMTESDIKAMFKERFIHDLKLALCDGNEELAESYTFKFDRPEFVSPVKIPHWLLSELCEFPYDDYVNNVVRYKQLSPLEIVAMAHILHYRDEMFGYPEASGEIEFYCYASTAAVTKALIHLEDLGLCFHMDLPNVLMPEGFTDTKRARGWLPDMEFINELSIEFGKEVV